MMSDKPYVIEIIERVPGKIYEVVIKAGSIIGVYFCPVEHFEQIGMTPDDLRMHLYAHKVGPGEMQGFMEAMISETLDDD